ncbi:hypothetical protein [Brevibacillus gelatini]|uniref:Uncharacterized protein n=1 Tax=Brevibacillus gelatini TaxID=1655277 RepID=A0A3M8B8J6_9BACL|nr:hypothetical protein [Brevibacillus gelatini]RNB59690.1 hypothetical protein EDM57_03350 [Brevibacillus gelatini]
MVSSLRAYLFIVMVASMMIAGCAQTDKVPADMSNHIEKELDAVEKVTVMSTDGQEVMLDLPTFMKELAGQGKDLQLSETALKQEDVRFTLVLYRKQLAPLVVAVGEGASQFGENTYRGAGAVAFYQWIQKLTGKGLLSQKINTVLLSAEDISKTRVLGETEMEAIRTVLAAAVPETGATRKQYPLYPNYRLRINSAERPLEVTVLTPTLISVPFGKETHTFHVDGELFSKLTEWIPPAEMEEMQLEQLFKASKIRIAPTGAMAVEGLELEVRKTTVEQGIAHQAVRLLQTAELLKEAPKEPGPEQYRLYFTVNGKEHELILYDNHFQIDANWFAHHEMADAMWKLLQSARK